MTEERIRKALRSVIDPEIGVNIVDLGLVYSVDVQPGDVHIEITMTTPACPLHGLITQEIERVLRRVFPDLGELTVDLVWSPPWSPEMMSETAKRQLGWAT